MIITEYVASFVPHGFGGGHLPRCLPTMTTRTDVSMKGIILLSLSSDFLLYLPSGKFSQSETLL